MASSNGLATLFFAFPDGVLQYVCAECTALCCRGQGFAGNVKREMDFLFRKYPPLAGMVTVREHNIVTCSTPAGRCFFLRQDNLCQIEVDNGKAYKPGVCLLFPFNDFYRIGNSVAVAPHFLCPLRVSLPASPERVEGSHAKIEATIRETALLEPEFVRRFVTDVTLPADLDAKSALQREIDFRDRCAAALGQRRFRDVVEACSKDSAELRSFRKRVAMIMNWSLPKLPGEPDSIDNVLLALASALRLEILHHSSEAILRFLTLAEVLTRRAFSMAQSAPTPQGVFGIVEDMRPMLQLLAWEDGAPELKKTAPKPPTFADPNLVYAAQMFLHAMPAKGVLRSLEKAVNPLKSPGDRTALVQQLADAVGQASRKRPLQIG